MTETSVSVQGINDAVMKSMKEQFYRVYGAHYEVAAWGGTLLMDKVLLLCGFTTFSTSVPMGWGGGGQTLQNAMVCHSKNVEGNQLLPKQMTGEMGRKAIYENVFSIIHQARIHLSHARDVRSQKTFIDYLLYGVPENAILV